MLKFSNNLEGSLLLQSGLDLDLRQLELVEKVRLHQYKCLLKQACQENECEQGSGHGLCVDLVKFLRP